MGDLEAAYYRECRDVWRNQAESLFDKYGKACSRLDALQTCLGKIKVVQPNALEYIRKNGFKWEGLDSLGHEPGNWQHLSFSLYTDICGVDSLASAALESLYSNEYYNISGDEVNE